MNKKFSLFTWVIVLLAIAALAGCSGISGPGGSGAEPTEVPVVKAPTGIIAEGKIVPNESVDLAFGGSGKVDEVLFEEGDQVKAGDVIARLGNREQLESAIAGAELELLTAQQSRADLVQFAEEEAIGLLKKISIVTKAVRDADYQLKNYTPPTSQKNLDPYEAVELTKEELDAARDAFEPYKNRSESDSTREFYKEALDDAQSEYNAAVRRLQLVIDLEAAESELDKTLEDYEKIKDGPDLDDVEAADARIAAAEAALASAQAERDRLDLVATIDGEIVTMDLIEGQQVAAGVPVLTLADFSQWYAETDNLTEIEVVNITLGQQAEVVPDALPDLTLAGEVESINEFAEEKRGDVTYTVRILLKEFDPRLRWGMTVLITFAE
jgi:multidrug efflux pump subunit AcrA (membrane-fusion protein)